jgi:hypothetical protein
MLKPMAFLVVLASSLVAPAVRAEDEINVSKGATLSGPGLAAHGYDVVAFFTAGEPLLGTDKFAAAYNGGTYRFAIQANLDAFKADPAKYEPAFGGFCAYGVALGKKFDGDPRFWRIVDGKLYLNLNGDIAAEWAKDISANISKADANWRRIREVPARSL